MPIKKKLIQRQAFNFDFYKITQWEDLFMI